MVCGVVSFGSEEGGRNKCDQTPKIQTPATRKGTRVTLATLRSFSAHVLHMRDIELQGLAASFRTCDRHVQ